MAHFLPRTNGRASLALGTMNFGKRTPEAEAKKMIARALERGVTVIDTANVYENGTSERIVGRALAKDRDRVVLATKVGAGRFEGRPEGLSPSRIARAIDESLERLGTDRVDVYYAHVPDPKTPLTETADAMIEVVRSGKARAWGVSNHASWEVLAMSHHADRVGGPRPVISQVLLNLLVRQIEIEHLRFCAAYDLHVTVYNALAGGMLAGKHERGAPPKGSRFDGNAMYQRRYWSDRFFELVSAYDAVASEAKMSLVELSYAWLAARPGIDSILIGPGSLAQLDAAIDACARDVDGATLARIDEISTAFAGTDARYAR
jgi:aryl-alcohol dehydrogenase-like predicted oxidoreductase